MDDIKTYPEMNGKICDILELSGDSHQVYASKRIKQLETENEKLKDLFGKIDRWCKAYPITIFPEPDFKKANKVLKENNISLSAISASNMRHVVNGISGLIQKALEDKDG